jgi:NAD(P)-dependent dehydrogenase (short-subunit alcohol dehydrogenase family)
MAPPRRLAVVSGGAAGIGRATALRLSREPDRAVLAIDVDADGLRATAEAARASGGHLTTAVADLSSSAACAEAMAGVEHADGLDLLVNIAGITTAPDSVELVTDEQLGRVWDVNVGSIFRLCRLALPLMRAAGGGAVINVASVHAYASMQDNAVYAATKGAIVALTRQMALDLAGDRVRVVAVAPGAVDTPMSHRELARRGLSPAEAGFEVGDRGIGRVADPGEIAEVIAWLGSPAASSINGTTVIADAGLLARLV